MTEKSRIPPADTDQRLKIHTLAKATTTFPVRHLLVLESADVGDEFDSWLGTIALVDQLDLAKRLAACWNACVGMPFEHIAPRWRQLMLSPLLERAIRAEQERHQTELRFDTLLHENGILREENAALREMHGYLIENPELEISVTRMSVNDQPTWLQVGIVNPVATAHGHTPLAPAHMNHEEDLIELSADTVAQFHDEVHPNNTRTQFIREAWAGCGIVEHQHTGATQAETTAPTEPYLVELARDNAALERASMNSFLNSGASIGVPFDDIPPGITLTQAQALFLKKIQLIICDHHGYTSVNERFAIANELLVYDTTHVHVKAEDIAGRLAEKDSLQVALREKLAKYEQASPDRSDFCPCCHQGWGLHTSEQQARAKISDLLSELKQLRDKHDVACETITDLTATRRTNRFLISQNSERISTLETENANLRSDMQGLADNTIDAGRWRKIAGLAQCWLLGSVGGDVTSFVGVCFKMSRYKNPQISPADDFAAAVDGSSDWTFLDSLDGSQIYSRAYERMVEQHGVLERGANVYKADAENYRQQLGQQNDQLRMLMAYVAHVVLALEKLMRLADGCVPTDAHGKTSQPLLTARNIVDLFWQDIGRDFYPFAADAGVDTRLPDFLINVMAGVNHG